MPINMRLSQSDARLYSPDRDLAYCCPHLMNIAISRLDRGKQEDWVEAYLLDHDITDEHLCEAAKAIAEYMNKSILDPQYKTPLEALTAVGFFNLPEAVRTVVCAIVGQVFMSAIFSSLRDVTRDPATPPYDTLMIAKTAEDLVKQITERKKHKTTWSNIATWLSKKWHGNKE